MATILLSEEEYQHLTNLHKDLVERAKTSTPRAATHLRTIAKLHSDFLAIENGKRAVSTMKADAKKARDAEKLQRQQERLSALQQKMQPAKADTQAPGSGQRPTSAKQA